MIGIFETLRAKRREGKGLGCRKELSKDFIWMLNNLSLMGKTSICKCGLSNGPVKINTIIFPSSLPSFFYSFNPSFFPYFHPFPTFIPIYLPSEAHKTLLYIVINNRFQSQKWLFHWPYFQFTLWFLTHASLMVL